jgi:hypothetical protein
MRILAAISGVLLLSIILWDAFETIILPRRVTRRFRLARLVYRSTWRLWSAIARRVRPGSRRESFLSFYGPLSLLWLFGFWALGLMGSFALVHWGLGSGFFVANGRADFSTDLYVSGTTFFTLGLGDVPPATPQARVVTVIEAGTGFGFLAIVISYLPVLYGAFSQREVNISLLDARAGSPPSAGEFLRRQRQRHNVEALGQYLRDWEIWSAQLMESHLSYPVLCYFRSQHNNQSWLAALTTVLDACALLIAYAEGELKAQAELTFAISRHAVVDLAQVLHIPPRPPRNDRLSASAQDELRSLLAACGAAERGRGTREAKLAQLQVMYEPYVNGLADRLLMPLPSWTASASVDNWRTSPWGRISAGPLSPPESHRDEHF